MAFIYETHCHTSETSKCASIGGADLAAFYKSLGYTGIVVTDHFFNGNTTVPRELPWAERVDLFTAGYRAAKAKGDEIGLDVFFAWEFSAGGGTDFLTYGLGIDWLLGHPDVDKLHINDYADLVHECGGTIIHAHPFREAGYIPMIRLVPRKVDGVEINGCRTAFENRMAEEYAKNYELPLSYGTDNHAGPRSVIAELSVETKLTGTAELGKAIVERRVSGGLVKHPEFA